MMTKTQAIVLHSFKYGDTKLVVDMYTRQYGQLTFMVGMPKTPRGRLKKQLFQPMMLLDIESDVRPRLQFQKLRDASLLTPLMSLLAEPSKLSISLFIAEFLYHALKSEQQNEPLFDYIRNSIEWLDGRQEPFANFHLVFLMRMSRFLGFYPNLEHYEPGDCFDLRASVFCKHPPLHQDFLMPPEASIVQLMMRMDYPTMHLYRLSRHDRQRLLDIALTYYRFHLPAFPELKSLEVLKELYDEIPSTPNR